MPKYKIKKCVIASGGQIESNSISFYRDIIADSDYIIGVDSGTKHILELGFVPNIVVGDLDSIDTKTLDTIKKLKIKIIKFDSRKDFTDTEIALNQAMKENPENIIIIGGIGDRIDHTLGNIHLLKCAIENGYKAKIVNKGNEIQLVKDFITIVGNKNDVVSLIPLTNEVNGIVTENLFYPLKDETLSIGTTRGISNVLIEDYATIQVKSGLLLVIRTFESKI